MTSGNVECKSCGAVFDASKYEKCPMCSASSSGSAPVARRSPERRIDSAVLEEVRSQSSLLRKIHGIMVLWTIVYGVGLLLGAILLFASLNQ